MRPRGDIERDGAVKEKLLLEALLDIRGLLIKAVRPNKRKVTERSKKYGGTSS